jgi:hypothetical protein
MNLIWWVARTLVILSVVASAMLLGLGMVLTELDDCQKEIDRTGEVDMSYYEGAKHDPT